MRVGILTFHEIYNPGAFFQAYATMKLVERMGHEPLIIDYTSPAHRFSPWRLLVRHPSYLFHLPTWFNLPRRHRAFAECQRFLRKTRRFSTREEVQAERFDAVLVGSDIVWDYQARHLGRDSIYFGSGLNTRRLIAFAPSCGGLLDLNRPIPAFVRKGLARFDAIAVRDTKTAELVHSILGRRPEIIPDPTLALSLSELPEVHNYSEDYILVYAIPGTIDAATQRTIVGFARKTKLRVVAVNYRHPWADVDHFCANPFEWLGRINCARHVFTTTFHGTLFALKMGKAFAVQYNPFIESKTRPIVEALGRQDRVCSGPVNLEKVLTAAWDVATTWNCMDALARKSTTFLSAALG